MSLTLELEEETPLISLSFLRCSKSIYQLVYQINKTHKLTLQKSRIPFKVIRNNSTLQFEYWESLAHDQQPFWIIDQRCTITEKGNSLFADLEEVESVHFLIKSQKKFPLIIIHENNPFLNLFNSKIIKHPYIQQHHIVALEKLNKIDIKHILDIYYDKQN